MTKLESFIRTGSLGPIAVGMELADLTKVLGEAPEISRKANPLLLRYGTAQFTFLKTHEDRYTLREILVEFKMAIDSTPRAILFSDWDYAQGLTEEGFNRFLDLIQFKPVGYTEGDFGKELIFPSGVIVAIIGGTVRNVRYREREAKRSKTVTVVDDSREPSIDQIHEMLREAEQASNGGAYRAALLLGWAALEAVLRRRIRRVHGSKKLGIQPALLIHELFAAGELSSSDHRRIEELRQRRSSVAHGLALTSVNSQDLSELRALTRKLMVAD